jgi:hypothetical protein
MFYNLVFTAPEPAQRTLSASPLSCPLAGKVSSTLNIVGSGSDIAPTNIRAPAHFMVPWSTRFGAALSSIAVRSNHRLCAYSANPFKGHIPLEDSGGFLKKR